MRGLSHERVDHEIRGVGLDDLCSLGFTDDMALIPSVEGVLEGGLFYHVCAELRTSHC